MARRLRLRVAARQKFRPEEGDIEMKSVRAIFARSGKFKSGWRMPIFTLTLATIVAFAVRPVSATVMPSEIDPNSVSATVSSTFDPVNGYSVTFRWTTAHPGTSVVIVESSSDYNANNNAPSRQISDSTITTNHVVVVDHFPAYTPYATWGYYVASHVMVPYCNTRVSVCWFWAAFPGPATAACGHPRAPGCGGYYLTFTMPTQPTNPTGPLAFTMWPIGGQNVYQGDPTQSPACTPTSKVNRECNDLYVNLQPNLMSGPTNMLVQMQNATITNTDTGQAVTDGSITTEYLCSYDAPSNPPPSNWDGDYNDSSKTCSNGTLNSVNSALRIRVNSAAVPGHYQFTGQFQAQYANIFYGNPVPVTYNFTVLPTASFTPTPPTTFPPIANQAAWENNMANPNPYNGQGLPYRSGEWWCTNNTDTNPWWSLDNGSFVGYFDIPSSIYFQAWNYDGGRIYQQISDYDYNVPGMPGYQNTAARDHWKRCAELAMEPYKDSLIGTLGGLTREPNQFPFGMEMNQLRTGDTTNETAIDYMQYAPGYYNFFSGSAYASSTRLSGYMMDNRLAAELVGEQRDSAFLLRQADVILGYLDQSYNLNFGNPNQQSYGIHPFTVGLAMEALITYYELDLAEGNVPDARIPLEIKKVLDWWQAKEYIPSTHTLAYQAYDLPMDPTKVAGLYSATELNDLVSPAYAWYWSKTNDPNVLAEGDDLFNHVFDSAGSQGVGGGWTYSVKEFNQVYKWSFDYVRWRTGQNPDGTTPAIETVQAAANPCEQGGSPCNAPWTDYTTPVSFSWIPQQNGQAPQILPNGLPAPVVTASTATFTFNVFKPNTTATVYYGTNPPGTCNLNDPEPPFCMQPFPNFGFVDMLTASYPNQSDTVTATQDAVALSEGVTNIYDVTITVTGLTPGTTYHWRPLTTDASGNMAAFYDQTFTTPAQ